MEELKRVYNDYVYYDDKMFKYSYTYYSLVQDNNKYYWRRWNIKYNCWFKILYIENINNSINELHKYINKQNHSF